MKPCHCRPISKACMGLELNHNNKIIVVQLLDSEINVGNLWIICLLSLDNWFWMEDSRFFGIWVLKSAQENPWVLPWFWHVSFYWIRILRMHAGEHHLHVIVSFEVNAFHGWFKGQPRCHLPSVVITFYLLNLINSVMNNILVHEWMAWHLICCIWSFGVLRFGCAVKVEYYWTPLMLLLCCFGLFSISRSKKCNIFFVDKLSVL